MVCMLAASRVMDSRIMRFSYQSTATAAASETVRLHCGQRYSIDIVYLLCSRLGIKQ